MSKEHGTPSGAFVNFLAALVKAAPRDLSDELHGAATARTAPARSRRALPDVITLTLGGRTYNVPRIIADGERVGGETMLVRARKKKATLGKEDGEWFLAHQDAINKQIPVERRGEIVFIFIDWRYPVGSGYVAIVYWFVGRWIRRWGWLAYDWFSRRRPVGRSA